MVKDSKLRTAMKHCANWDSGDCLGCMMNSCNKVLIFRILSKFANKSCQVDKKCDYFNNTVVPGISNGI
jgi:hypothetical protein